MEKAQKGDLIRITESDDAPKGTIYEVLDTDEYGDAYVDGTFSNGDPLYFCEEEYVIHRKAGEEDSALDIVKQAVGKANETPKTLVDGIYVRNEAQDAVNSPNHYTQGKFETIEVIEEITKGYSDGYVAYCVGNALKYLARAPFKHGEPTEDLAKAAKYLAFANEYLDAKSTQD